MYIFVRDVQLYSMPMFAARMHFSYATHGECENKLASKSEMGNDAVQLFSNSKAHEQYEFFFFIIIIFTHLHLLIGSDSY